MSSAADVVVIGGGVMGLFTARALAAAGVARVVVLERRALGSGSSGKSGAILRQHYSHDVTVRMARESLRHYAEYEARTGRGIGFRRSGMILLCSAGDRAALDANVALQQRLGVENEILDAAALRALDGRAMFGDDVIGCLEPEAGYVEPMRVLAAVADECRAAGVEIRTQCPVTDVRVEGGAVRGVSTSDGRIIDAPVVVNAGGPWASILCRRLDLDVPLRAIRPEQAYFAPPVGAEPERYVWGDLLTGIYWKPEPAGWTRVGNLAYAEDADVPDPDHYDEGVSNAFIQSCRDRLAQRLPEYRHAVCWGGCGALYTVTPDAHPLVGPVKEIPGFYIVSGFSGHGFKLGPAVGAGVAAMITDGDTGAFDPTFFAVDRFGSREVTTSYKYSILG